MDKTFGEKKIKYINKNKFNKKKQKYSDHRNKEPKHRVVRHYVKSHINHIFNNKELLNNFIFPSISSNSYTWSDCKPYKPKVY